MPKKARMTAAGPDRRAAPPPLPAKRPPRIQIEDLRPLVDGGRYRAKRCSGDTVGVSATIFRDGHEIVRAVTRYRRRGERGWREVAMAPLSDPPGGDRWGASFTVEELGRWEWRVEAFSDHLATWRDELRRKVAAGEIELSSELAEGAALLAAAAGRASAADAALIAAAADTLRDERIPVAERCEAAMSTALADACARAPDRSGATRGPVVELDVERVRARTGCWYELFPRSWGGFAGVELQLDALAALGVDVLYLPPIHPIGVTDRKGPNDTPVAGPGDPGSPWAIGSAEGGHEAVHPELGTLAGFDALVGAAGAVGIEIALDFAVQCSADHPWLRQHPEWFQHRPDGTLKYAENPPKRYRDVYNLDFDCEDWQGLWSALLGIVLHWLRHGVRVFRVDNPHTKPLAFWEWLIESVRAVDPGVVFLSEAFTRETMMLALAKAGFSQSYTYFTWKNTRWELVDYVRHLAAPPTPDYFRPNFFVNTPDILSDYLQHSGPAGFASRLVLAATLSPSYGLYSGFECYEAVPRQEGSEEYLDSEKYQLRERALDGPLLGLLARLNEIRREHPALARFDNVTFLETDNEALIGYAKREGDDVLLIVVTIDPAVAQEGGLRVPAELGLPAAFAVRDLLTGERYQWQRERNYVRLDPRRAVAHVLEPIRA